MAQRDLANLRRTAWDVKWGTFDLGYVDKVDPSGLKMLSEPISVGTLGKKTKVGDRILGLEGQIKITAREVTSALIASMCPWGASGTFPLVPGQNVDLYQYAATLTLHPHDLAADDLSQDIVISKAACMTIVGAIERAGDKDDEMDITFEVYPDRAALTGTTSTLTYGRSGVAPS